MLTSQDAVVDEAPDSFLVAEVKLGYKCINFGPEATVHAPRLSFDRVNFNLANYTAAGAL